VSNIEYYGGSSVSRSSTRLVGRTLARIDGNTNVDIARVEARAEVDTCKVDALTAVTQRGLQGAAYITSVEVALSEATPAAMGRLKLIADQSCMSLSGIVMDTASKLRRI
jgi:hypothetical protein